MNEGILSVGIDIGTTTTSLVVSRLFISNTAASYMVPDVSITKKEILYKSELYMTPLTDRETLNGERIREIVEYEYKRAGIKPEQIETGAVIITGESSLKKNAEIVINSLSRFAGEFVVTTAGPELESIIAGRGSGAEEFSKTYGCIVANLDVGGGTTNISVFNCGDLVGQTCLDVGGRLVTYDNEKRITYVSERFSKVAETRNIDIHEGQNLTDQALEEAGRLLADIIFDSIHKEHYSLTKLATTQDCGILELTEPIQYISFSGGVGDCYYSKEESLYKYGDLGVVLAQKLSEKQNHESFTIIKPKETVRATVVGAGTYTTEVSGSTISYNENIFPIRNLPIFVVGADSEEEMYMGEWNKAYDELHWYMEQSQEQRLGLCVKGKEKTTYKELVNLAESLIRIDKETFEEDKPLLIICENDMAKALGQVIGRKMERDKCVICLDRIKIRSGDYVDIGKPVMDGIAVPVVVKTLIFN